MSEIYRLDLDEELLSHLPDPEAWVVLRGEGFKAALIEEEDVREIYEWAAAHVREHKQAPTATVLADEFDLDLGEPETAIGDLIDRMRLRYMETEGRKALEQVGKEYKADPLKTASNLIKTGQLLSDLLHTQSEMYGSGDADRAKEHYDRQEKAGIGPSIIGDEGIDAYFHGQRGVTVLLKPPKTLGSWLMVKGALQNVRRGVYPWLYALELPAYETDMRLRCMLANIPWWKYLKSKMDRYEWEIVKETSNEIDGEGTYRIVKPKPGERSLAELVGKAKDAGAQVVYIDQLQYVEIDGRSLGDWNDTGRYFGVLNEARDLSDEIPIIFAHQFNRQTMNADEMPRFEHAKGSNAIGEVATLVLGLWASKEMRESHILELGTLASRNYDYCNWRLAYDLSQGCNIEVEGVVEDE